MSDPKRVLLIKPSALGDIVHALPIATLLKRRWPRARLSWLVNSGFAEIVERHAAVDEAIHFDRKRIGTFTSGSGPIARVAELAEQLSARQFDMAIDLQGLARSAVLTLASLAPVRVGFGYARELAPMAYNVRVASRGRERHAIERYLDVAEQLGCGRGPVNWSFDVRATERARVEALLAPLRGERFALLLPGTNWPTKRWPAERFAGLAALLARDGLRIAIGGGPDVSPIARAITATHADALDLTGRTNLFELIDLLGRAAVVITNDSGPMHLAAALGRPMVSLFGPTSAVRTGPFGRSETVVRLPIACAPCYRRTCSHHSCMRGIGAEVVAEATRHALPARLERM